MESKKGQKTKHKHAKDDAQTREEYWHGTLDRYLTVIAYNKKNTQRDDTEGREGQHPRSKQNTR